MISDAFQDTSGAIDAAVWVLVYGTIGAVIWLSIRNWRINGKYDDFEDSNYEKDLHQIVTSNNHEWAQIETDRWELPFHSSGYIKGPGWYTDPSGKFEKRYFAGARWTDRVRDRSGKEILESSVREVKSKTNLSNIQAQSKDRSDQEIGSTNQLSDELNAIVALFKKGLLTAEEFATAKSKILKP